MQFFPSRGVFLLIGENIAIRWYAVCILTGALITFFLAVREGKKAGYDSDMFDDLFIGCLGLGIIGARLWFCLFYDFAGYFSNPISIIEIWDGGLAIQGGLIFGAAFAYFYCKVNHISFMHIADNAMPKVLVAQALGRWGNYANQECYGPVVDESFFDGILSFIKEGMYIGGEYRMPMFFFESSLCLIGFVLIEIYRRRKGRHRGDGFFGYLAWYGAIRFWIESQRTDSLMWGDIRVAQLISVIFMIMGILGLLGVFKKLYMNKKPLLIFDLDGTLLNTQPVIEASFQHVFDKYLPDYQFSPEEKAGFMGPTLEQTFRKYTPDADIEAEISMYREHNTEHQKDMVFPFEHTVETLEWLKENGYQMVIASSKRSETVRLGLQVNGMEDYFEDIVGYEQIDKPKPDKECLVTAYKQAKRGLDNAVYVGDVDTDMLAARNAGVYAVALASNPLNEQKLADSKPNALIHDIAELKEILKEDHPWTYSMM